MYANQPFGMERTNRHKLRSRHCIRRPVQAAAMAGDRPRCFSDRRSARHLLPAPCFRWKRFERVSRVELLDHPYARSPELCAFAPLSLDDSPDTVEAFQAQAKLPWRMVCEAEQVRQAREKYKVRTIPSLFLVGRDGRIAQVDLKGNDLRRAVERCLAEK